MTTHDFTLNLKFLKGNMMIFKQYFGGQLSELWYLHSPVSVLKLKRKKRAETEFSDCLNWQSWTYAKTVCSEIFIPVLFLPLTSYHKWPNLMVMVKYILKKYKMGLVFPRWDLIVILPIYQCISFPWLSIKVVWDTLQYFQGWQDSKKWLQLRF